jgi:type II secretory pathway component GspD/PulD (secretin)
VIKLQHAKASDVAEAIQAAYGGGTKPKKRSRTGRGSQSGGSSSGGGGARFTISGDDATKQLFVTATDELFVEIESIARSLDVVRTLDFEFKIYPLQYADAKVIFTKMEAMITDYMRKLGRGAVDEVEPFSVEVDEDANALIVLGTPVVFGFVEDALVKIDTPENAANPRRVAVFPLKKGLDAQEMAQNIKQLWAQRGRQPTEEPPTAEANRAMNMLVVRGKQKEIDEIREMFIDPLEDDENITQLKTHVIQIDNADADSVATTLSDVFVKSVPRQQSGQEAPISISALQGSNALVVKCDDEDFEKIEAAIKELDNEEALAAEEVRVVTLLYADATEMQTVVQEYLRKPGGKVGRGGAELIGDMRISVLAQGNSVVVSGDKERVESIEGVIRQLDEAGEKGSIPQIIPLKYAKVAQILPSLQDMFTEKRGGKKGQIAPVIVANDTLNVIIARASPTEITAMEAIVEKLDIPEVEGISDYRLVKVAATLNVIDLAETVETSVNEGARMRIHGDFVPSITVIPDRRIHAVVLAGSASLFDAAETLIKEMEKTSGTAELSTRILTLQNRNADDILRVIDTLKGDSVTKGRSKRSSSKKSSGSKSKSRSRSSGSRTRR